MNKQVANITFWSIAKSDMDSDIGRLSRELLDTISDCNDQEAKQLHGQMFDHLIAIRNLVEKFDEQIEARQEAERVAELAEREDFILDMDDGSKVKFNGPQGWDSKTGVIMTYDLFDLVVEEGQITSAKRMYMGRCSSLSEWDINVCNSLLQRV